MYKFNKSYFLLLSLVCSVVLTGVFEDVSASSNQQITYQYPVKSAKNVLPSTGIGIRVAHKVEKNSLKNNIFSVIGTQSGGMDGYVSLSDDQRTIIYTPTVPFQPGEKVNVVIRPNPIIPESSFEFTISATTTTADKMKVDEELFLKGSPFLQLPQDTLPPPTFTVWASDSPSEGYLFLQTLRAAPNNTDGYLMVIDNAGQTQWIQYNPFVSPNFQPHKDGRYSYLRQTPIATDAKYVILDSNLQEIGQIKAPNEFSTKLHELLLLPNGHSMVLGRYTTLEDMSAQVPGGQTGVSVDQSAIIEYDASGNKVFEWRTEDHYKITDATHEDLTAQMINYSFINALSIDNDGQLLISSRRMDEITKVDRETGNIIWRMGGKNNQFTLLGDTLWFSHAHNIQSLPNGHYILFDNGLYHTPKVSRAVEYAVDTTTKTVTQVWQFTHPDSIAGDMMGSVQRLDNGNTLIGWGTNTSRTCTEVTPDGKIALDMSMSGSTWSYRVYKAIRNLPKASARKSIGSNLLNLCVFPNPVSTSAVLSYTTQTPSNVSYSIIDAIGRKVQNNDLGFVNQGTNTSFIPVDGLAKGVYMVEIRADGKHSICQIVVE